MDTREFLHAVITTEGEGWFCLALGDQQGEGWWEEWYRWPNDVDKILAVADKYASSHNVYFSSYLFKEPKSTKANVLPSRTIQADLDAVDLTTLSLAPSVLVETSPGRYQGYWILNPIQYHDDEGGLRYRILDPDSHEVLSQKVSYSIEGCDKTGWPLGKKVRLPGTVNYKYLDGPKDVQIITAPMTRYDTSTLELLPSATKVELDQYDEDFLNNPVELDIGPQELLAKSNLPGKIVAQYDMVARDRSIALWALMTEAFRHGLTKEQVYWLAKHSANNKFDRLRHNAHRELAKDVLRAERTVKKNLVNERAIIRQARNLRGPSWEKKAQIAKTVIDIMRKVGDFHVTDTDVHYYVPHDTGRPLILGTHSNYLNTFLDVRFGLNSSEEEHRYTVHAIYNHARALAPNSTAASLSHYDQDSNTILIHTGRQQVIRVTKTNIASVHNGAYGILFPWINNAETFTPNPLSQLDWAEFLYRSCVESVVGVDGDDAVTLLKVWTLFVLFKNVAASRPILTLIGMPGSGKSTLLKTIYKLMYGRYKAVAGITRPDDFDHGTSVDPVYFIDNVDTYERWLLDRLALSVSASEVSKRMLYTDNDDFTIKRDAIIGVSAFNPRFIREDIADRMLLINFKRRDWFGSETVMYDNIVHNRGDLWGAVIRDLQRILNTPKPKDVDTPQFRIKDFSYIGHWIASALGIEKRFAKVIESVKKDQGGMVIEEEDLLVEALSRICRREEANRNGVDPFSKSYSAGQLWTICQNVSDDPDAFARRYKNAQALGRKLFTMHDVLQRVFDIEWETNTDRGTRIWRFKERRN